MTLICTCVNPNYELAYCFEDRFVKIESLALYHNFFYHNNCHRSMTNLLTANQMQGF